MRTEVITLQKERNVTLTAYLQDVGGEFANISKRPAALILPGGAYLMCSDREADPVAYPYLKAGYQVFILRYSVGEGSVWPNPLDDYEEAMAMIKSRSDEWNVYDDKIVVIGFSAGGHLAACAATMSVNRPQAAILGYPVIEGECAQVFQKTAPDVIQNVGYGTCPCFVFATRTDTVVPVKNTIHFLDALAENDVAFESHIYSNGPHAFSTCDSSVQPEIDTLCSRVPDWVGDSLEWLKDVLGDFGSGQMTAPRFGSRLNGNHDPYLNIDCTLGYLMEKPQVAEALQLTKTLGIDSESGIAMMAMMPIRQILGYGNAPEEVLEQIDSQLRQFENK